MVGAVPAGAAQEVAGPPSRAFARWVVGVALALLALALWLASAEGFYRDDWIFLQRMQSPESWSWREVFLPFERRLWIFWRRDWL